MNSSCGFRSRVTLSPSNYIFVFTSVSLSDIPFLSEMIGRFEKLFSTRLRIRLQCSITIYFKFLTAGWYVTKEN